LGRSKQFNLGCRGETRQYKKLHGYHNFEHTIRTSPTSRSSEATPTTFRNAQRKEISTMSQIAALAAANVLPQNAVPLIQGATAPQNQGNAAPTASTQDTVSISSEAKELQGHEK
jgi:hypothetical protein